MATSRPQPLFYQSSKCVDLYLDANIRFQLSLRCPTFQTVHQAATLRIHDLKMRPNDFVVNDTTFTLGVIQKYTTTPTPESVKLLNASGGIQYDVDRYGLSEEDCIRVSKLNDSTLKEELYIAHRVFERRIYDNKYEAIQLECLAHHMRLNNQEPPYTHYLQLTMTTGTVQKVERLEYDNNFKISSDYIIEKMFGVARKKVQIKNLQIDREALDLQLMRHIQNAEFLCVAGTGSLKVFNVNQNNRIHFAKCNDVETDFADFVNICSKVGQFYSIGFQHQTTVEEFFEMFRNLPGAETGKSDESRLSQFPECIIISMSDETELNVWFEKTNEEDKVYCNTEFTVKIKVQNRGHAHVI
ncbi:hypothetical protein GCK72_004124 [Caenorhabditis remanei]|uniref:Uncharacterized protein n=1 Tax=Caenorhabditis remanei TaxID=31234 RepID=A0A6A5HAK1_CAERE|nr:hypothetical protein GCK72_004124 [Caenorhabditis remanei]KAF1764177.1 hypothetical protein GCK72_004124 [Caenorhabditis remanei]